MTQLIYTKLHAIQSELGKLRMEGVGPSTQGSYKYLKVDTILENLAPLLKEHGVIIYPVLAELRTDYKYGQEPPVDIAPEKWSGRIPTTSIHEQVIFQFHFVAIEDGSEIIVTSAGEAKSNDDKGINKATRAAQKNALIQAFSIVTGEPETESFDRDDETRPEPKRSIGQQKIDAAKSAPKVRTIETQDAGAPNIVAVALDTDDTPIGELRSTMRDLQGEHSLTMQQVNFIATEVTGLQRGKWFTQTSQLKKIIAAVKDDSQREKLLAMASTGEVDG